MWRRVENLQTTERMCLNKTTAKNKSKIIWLLCQKTKEEKISKQTLPSWSLLTTSNLSQNICTQAEFLNGGCLLLNYINRTSLWSLENVSHELSEGGWGWGWGWAERPTASPDRNTQNTVHSQHKQATLRWPVAMATLLNFIFDVLKNTPMCASHLRQFQHIYYIYLFTSWCFGAQTKCHSRRKWRSPHSINSACVTCDKWATAWNYFMIHEDIKYIVSLTM